MPVHPTQELGGEPQIQLLSCFKHLFLLGTDFPQLQPVTCQTRKSGSGAKRVLELVLLVPDMFGSNQGWSLEDRWSSVEHTRCSSSVCASVALVSGVGSRVMFRSCPEKTSG